MGDLLGLIALLVLYIVASSTNKKKKNAAQKSDATASREKAITSSVRQNQEKIPAAKKKKKNISKNISDVKNRKPVDVYHPVTPEPSDLIFSDSVIQNKASGAVNQEAQTESRDEHRAFANDIMRGVIMNEILTRPNEREIIRRMRQGR